MKLAVPGGDIWFDVAGDAPSTPLVLIHGGPGFPSYYLAPHTDLSTDRPVVFYDQLGCGQSDRPDDVSLWTIERFVAELECLLAQLKYERVFLLGHSWGAVVAAELALAKPELVQGLILASPAICVPRWCEDAKRLQAQLSYLDRIVLDDGERTKNYTSEPYIRAVRNYYARFVEGMDVKPPEMEQSEAEHGHAVYGHMWGPNELIVNGTLARYDISPRLPGLHPRTLYTCGRFDEATPETCEYLRALTPDAELAVFENSAHQPHWTDREDYMTRLGSFFSSS